MASGSDVHVEASSVPTVVLEEQRGGESAADILTLLQKLKETIENSPQLSSCRQDVICHLVTSSSSPYLTVWAAAADDPLLVDWPNVRLECRIDPAEMRLDCAVRAWNRRLVKTFFCQGTQDSLLPLIREMADTSDSRRFVTCQGFDETSTFFPLFARLRKADIASILIESFDQKVIYRSRECVYVTDTHGQEGERDNTSCQHCLLLCKSLDDRYFDGKFLRPLEETDPVGVLKEEKGSNVSDFDAPKVKRKVVKRKKVKVEIKMEEEVLQSDEAESHQEDGSRVRKSSRSRVVSKILSEYDPGVPGGSDRKRKRGRPPLQPGPLECDQCNMKFEMVKELRRHLLNHTNKFACEFGDCDRRFRVEKELEIHMRKHKGEKPYVCSDCGKAYENRQDWKIHLVKHTDDTRPFKCEVCGRGFPKKQQRDIHLAVHTGAKNHLCSTCGAAFGSQSTLIDHKKRTHLRPKVEGPQVHAMPQGLFRQARAECPPQNSYQGKAVHLSRVRQDLYATSSPGQTFDLGAWAWETQV